MLTDRLPEGLYCAEQVRAMDRYAIEHMKVPGIVLMQRAGRAAFCVLRHHWPEAKSIAVLCGGGNNGGDGYILARYALDEGLAVTVFALSPPDRLQGDALLAWESYRAAKGEVTETLPITLEGFDVVVDALLGTGLDREVAGKYAQAISHINAFSGGVLAIDIPSGLHADTGAILGHAVEADASVTFIGLKRGLFTGEGPACAGKIWYADLEVAEAIPAGGKPAAWLLSYRNLLPPRRRTAHKGHFGHVLVVGGEVGFTGAARMAAEAALRVGAGLVSVATRKSHAAYLNLGRPEIMAHGVETPEELERLLQRATVAAIGPGLGQSEWAKSLLRSVLASSLPLVVDADALNLLAQVPAKRENWILTPHPGEAARLLGSTSAAVQKDRFAALAGLIERYGGVSVLKGAGTLIGTGGQIPWVCALGNPGMASGGMGDVLTGVLAGLMAQGLKPLEAARMGVSLHAAAADAAAAKGERGMLASDLLPWLYRLLNR
ncbi:MAG: NAD(P)H-hydrate dehydratase [Methylohalobius sp.]|nr:NAD(P)H-hydrate dehydratase [Methylohalobius sp.]